MIFQDCKCKAYSINYSNAVNHKESSCEEVLKNNELKQMLINIFYK